MFTLSQGNFQLPGGGPVASGVLTLTLSNPSATVIATGASATPLYTITLDTNGNIPAGTSVFGNAELAPAGTFYTASLVTSGGTPVTLTNNVWVVGPSAPYSGTLFPDVNVYPLIGSSTVGGVTITGTPTTGQVITATSSSAANWQTPSSGSRFADGTVSAPSISFTNETNSGLYRAAAGDFRFSIAGSDEVKIDANGFNVASGDLFRWGSSGVTSPDTGLSRLAAGSVALGNGTASDTSGKLSCSRVFTSTSNANVTPVTVTGTTSQTALQALTLSSGELNAAGRWITVKARGVLSAGATPGTWTLTLKIGTTTLLTTTVTPGASTTNIPWWYEADIMTQTAGVTGALEVAGTEILTNVTSFAFTNTGNPVTGIDLTGSPTLTLFCTNTQTATSCTSRQMGYQRNN